MASSAAAVNDGDHVNVNANANEAAEPKKQALPFSPAARAFFAALDGQQKNENNRKKKESNSNGSKNSSSLFIQKRIQSLGWRNRYSQTERYPVHMQAPHNNVCSAQFTFTVRQFQRGEEEGTYGTGATVWPASMVLLKYLERLSLHSNKNSSSSNSSQSPIIAGRRVFELGAGTGVATIAAAVLGASYCLCTDGEPPVVRLARDNVAAAALELNHGDGDGDETDSNTHKKASTSDDDRDTDTDNTTTIRNCPVAVQKYRWGTDTHQLLQRHGPCDVILVSDCVLPKLYPMAPLVRALDELLPPLVLSDNDSETQDDDDNNDNNIPVAILSYEHRHYPDYHPKEHFVALCEARNLHVETVPADHHDPVYSVDDIEIWRVRRRRRRRPNERPPGAAATI